MDLKGCVVVFIGIPGVGKTSLCMRILEKFTENGGLTRPIHVCYDKVVDETFLADLNYAGDGKMWKAKRQKVEEMCDDLVNRLMNEKYGSEDTSNDLLCQMKMDSTSPLVLLIDDNMYYSSMRYRWYQFARKHRFGYCQVFLHCSVETAKKRNGLRAINERIKDEVISRMVNRMEIPSHEKNSFEISTVVLDVENLISDPQIIEVNGFIMDAINQPVPLVENNDEQKMLSQIECSKNVVHQCDIILRKIVGEVIKKSREDNCSGVSYDVVNGRKLQMLENISKGNIIVDEYFADENVKDKDSLKQFLSNLFG